MALPIVFPKLQNWYIWNLIDISLWNNDFHYFAILSSESLLKGSPEFNLGPQLCRPLTYRDSKYIFGKILCIMTRTRSNDNPVLGVLFSHNLWYDIYVECQILAYRTTREKKHWSIKLSLQIKMMKGITFYWMHKKKLFN